MKVLVSALVVGFALLIALVPSSDAIICVDLYGCETKLGDVESVDSTVDCDECAGWGCFYNNKYYYGMGCSNGDDNICKIGNNQNMSYEEEKGYFFICSTDKCAFDKFYNQMKERRDPKQMSFLSDEPCNIYDKRIKNDTSIICEKQNTCERKSYKIDEIVLEGIHCDECAGWSCIINNTLYTGYGCKGDNNICKAGNNQNETEKYENSSWFVTCNIDRCASRTLSEFMMIENATLSKENYNDDGVVCNPHGLKYVLESTCKQLTHPTQLPNNNQLPHPKQLSGKTTTTNSNEAKTNGVLKTAGMVLLGCLFVGF